MPEQKMTYHEKLQMVKGEMAYRHWRPDRMKTFTYWEDFFHYDAIARIAAQAEAIRAFEKACTKCFVVGGIDAYLLEHGYIEPKTEDNEIYGQ